MSVVNPEIVKQVARLARLELEGTELALLATQMDAILAYVQQLSSVATDRIEPTSHVLPLANLLRPDAVQPSLKAEQVMALAPASRAPFVAVPKVIETER
jgi:aspartyl-tRNA(Asn)/glutamyl-tRNA(Gln) amidotransferase subunit C